MEDTRFSMIVGRIGRILVDGLVLQGVLLLASAPMWLALALSPLPKGEQLSPAWLAGILVLSGAFTVPALVAGSWTVSQLRDGATSIWTSFIGFFRRNYLSALRLGAVHALVWAALLGLIWTSPVLAIVPGLIWVVTAGQSLGFEAHLHLTVRENLRRSVILMFRTPGLALLAVMTWTCQAFIVSLAPGILLAGLVIIAWTVNYFFHHALARVAN